MQEPRAERADSCGVHEVDLYIVPAKCAAEKLEACEGQVAHSGRMGRYTGAGAGDKKQSGADQQLHKICCDANKLALEHIKGVSSQVCACFVANACRTDVLTRHLLVLPVLLVNASRKQLGDGVVKSVSSMCTQRC